MNVSEGRVVVTGASRGIGRAVAEAILDRGGKVIAIARNSALLEELHGQAEARVRTVVADLGDVDRLPAVAERALAAFEGVDGLVNCAGMAVYERVGAIRLESLQAQLRLNLVTPLLLSQIVAAHLHGRGGAIVNVSSTLAERVAVGTAAYAASKAALNALTKTLALELAPAGVRVNAVLPGVVDTDMVRVPRGEAELEALRSKHPIGRLGQPEDVASVVVGLLDHSWQTGSLVSIDGGLSLA